MEELLQKYPVSVICKVLGLSRSGYYKWRSRKQLDKDKALRKVISDIQKAHRNAYGYRRVGLMLSRIGCQANHKRVLRIMRENGLLSVIRRKKYRGGRSATDVRMAHVYPNLLARDFEADALNKKWATDVTTFVCGSNRLYLSVIVDLYNNEVVAWHTSTRNDNELVLTTISKARKRFNDLRGIVLHSDRGSQYTSHDYNRLVTRLGLVPSMSRTGNCLDNACAESFFSHLKAEAFLGLQERRTAERVRHTVVRYLKYYNETRIQVCLNGKTPAESRRLAS